MTTKKISNINDEFDIELLFYIAKRNFLFAVIFLVIAGSAAYFYLRWTYPIYATNAIIQVNPENQADKILNTANLYEDPLAKKIELLRSSVFLDRVFSKLPMKVSYYTKGTILNSEQYKSNPYEVQAVVKQESIYGLPIYISFPDRSHYVISYTPPKSGQVKQVFLMNQQAIFPEFEMTLNMLSFEAVSNLLKAVNQNSMFFILNNPMKTIDYYTRSLKIRISNEAAKTIEISLQDRNANKASDIVNTMADEFTTFDIEKKQESANKIILFIDQQLELIRDTLLQSEHRLESFKRTNKIDTTFGARMPSLFSSMDNLESQVTKLGVEEKELAEIEQYLANTKEIDVYKLIAFLSVSEMPGSISSILQPIQQLLLQKQQLLYEVTPNSGQIQNLDYQINIQKNIIIQSIRTLKENISARKDELNGKILDYKHMFNSDSGQRSSVELNRLQRMYSINESYYNQLIEKKANYSIAKAGYVSQNIILKKSVTPAIPVSPNRDRTYLICLLAGLLTGLGLIVTKYLLFNKITSINDIIKYTTTPVLGIIPKYKRFIPSNMLIVDEKPHSIISEAFRSVRTNLQFISSEPGPKIIAITSTVSGEGKTFVAMNLSEIIAFSDRKVIVLDLDLRRPKAHLAFGVENRRGLSSYLSGKDPLDDCIQKSHLPYLDFITAGPIPPNPSELILSDKLDQMIILLKERYDFVVIDTPPVGMVTDGVKSIQIADYPIYVFRANYSKRIFIQNLERLIHESGIKRFSLVLNAIEPLHSRYRYGKHYGYGYGVGYEYGYGYGYGEEYYGESKRARKNKFPGNIVRWLFGKK